jgi:hypothetical protein
MNYEKIKDFMYVCLYILCTNIKSKSSKWKCNIILEITSGNNIKIGPNFCWHICGYYGCKTLWTNTPIITTFNFVGQDVTSIIDSPSLVKKLCLFLWKPLLDPVLILVHMRNPILLLFHSIQSLHLHLHYTTCVFSSLNILWLTFRAQFSYLLCLISTLNHNTQLWRKFSNTIMVLFSQFSFLVTKTY